MVKISDLNIKIDTENKTKLATIRADRDLMKLSLSAMTAALDELITACLTENGPTRGDIAKARGYLPPKSVNSYPEKRK